MRVPTTLAELSTAANLPFHEGNRLISLAPKPLVERWGRELYGSRWGQGYMHSTDHYAALLMLLGQEPTYRQVYDSYHSGSKNIDLAREAYGGGERPADWDRWSNSQKLYAVLAKLNGTSRGGRIFDEKMKDPNPGATAALYKLWNGEGKEEEKPTPKPEPEPKPKPEPIEPTPKPEEPKLPTPRYKIVGKGTATITDTNTGATYTVKIVINSED